MRKGIFLISLMFVFSIPVVAATYMPKQFANPTTGEGFYPYSLNNRRQQLPTTQNNIAPIGNGITPMQQYGKRGVVKRPVRARASTTNTNLTKQNSTRYVVPRSNVMRSATTNKSVSNTKNRTISNRGVAARGATITNQARSTTLKRSTTNTTTKTSTTSQKCFANYKECMEAYCKREDTPYNRCYCSARLAQIDNKYQDKIDSLVQRIYILVNTTTSDSDEDLTDVKTYWNETVSSYTHTNPWANIDEALQIKWADTESRVRGQNAFNTGHQYCVNYLKACSYMASNLRDAYKTEITRDCNAYEDTLKQIKTIAESVIANYDK